jgi:hypothetical protein
VVPVLYVYAPFLMLLLTPRQMQDIISFRGLDSLKTSSENSNEMARLADIDTKNMVKLTTKSQKDASTLKKVTWLTSIYLPASFVSVSQSVRQYHDAG